jgi:hypothetical protein
MSIRDFFNLILKYAIFGLVIFLVVMKIPAGKVADKDNLLITLVSVAVFILLELFGGYFKKAKDVLCGCSTNSSGEPLVL